MTAEREVSVERLCLSLALYAMNRAWESRFKQPLRAHRERKRAEALAGISIFRVDGTDAVRIYRPSLRAIAEGYNIAGRQEEDFRDLAAWADKLIQHEQDQFAQNPPPNRRARFIQRDGEVSEEEVRAFTVASRGELS